MEEKKGSSEENGHKQNQGKDSHKHLKWRRPGVLLSIVLLIVLLFVGSAVLTFRPPIRDVTKAFPTQIFTVGAHPTLILQTINVDIHIQYGNAGSIKVEAKASASGLNIGSNLDFSSFKLNSKQSGDIVTINAYGNVNVIGASKSFDLTITVPKTASIKGYNPQTSSIPTMRDQLTRR